MDTLPSELIICEGEALDVKSVLENLNQETINSQNSDALLRVANRVKSENGTVCQDNAYTVQCTVRLIKE